MGPHDALERFDGGHVVIDVAVRQRSGRPEVLAIGEAAGLPASEAGSVAHFEGETPAPDIGPS